MNFKKQNPPRLKISGDFFDFFADITYCRNYACLRQFFQQKE
jgi:hypothetical protein